MTTAARSRCYLTALGLVNALGTGKAEVAVRLFAGDTTGLVLREGWLAEGMARCGAVAAELPRVPREWCAKTRATSGSCSGRWLKSARK